MGKVINYFYPNIDTVLKNGLTIEKLNHRSLDKISHEWDKFMKGLDVDPKIISDMIKKSWQRSLEYNVDPYHQTEEFLTKEEIKKQVSNNESLVKKFGDIILDIQRLARKNGLVIQIFNKEARNIQLIASSSSYKRELDNRNYILTNVSENTLGTNAVCLALMENRPVQVLGPEHFNHNLHNNYCFAAPIHNSNGDIIGAINISSYSHKHSVDNLMLVTFLAKLFDNISFIWDTIDELESYNDAINKTIEFIPQGILYVDSNDKIKCINNKLVNILCANAANINEQVSKLLVFLKDYETNDNLENEIIEFKNGVFTKPLAVTLKKITHPEKSSYEKIILIEEQVKSADSGFNETLYTFNDIVGQNEKLLEAKRIAQKVAKSNSSILIFGENGTGKEVFAQSIHNASTRRGKPFIAINCGAIPNELVESELFGYDTGAFTGAIKGGKKGKLELASGGTLFLDEIESMPLNMQVKLLRALSSKRICRVGGIKEIPIDVRIISATKKDLLEEADNGNFREDLYYRISTIAIKLPTLHERQEDIRLLTNHFIDKYSSELNLQGVKVNPVFYDALARYAWRGNFGN